jgi:hypothetical protein
MEEWIDVQRNIGCSILFEGFLIDICEWLTESNWVQPSSCLRDRDWNTSENSEHESGLNPHSHPLICDWTSGYSWISNGKSGTECDTRSWHFDSPGRTQCTRIKYKDKMNLHTNRPVKLLIEDR